MDAPWMDLNLFSPRWLHQKLGLNIIQPVLPLHGPRSTGWRSGDHYLDGDMTDLVYAESQALWDLRRTLAWLRANEPGARVGENGRASWRERVCQYVYITGGDGTLKKNR